MENVGSNQSLVRIVNQELIVEEIRRHKQLSRSELAKMLKLSNPSISKNVEDLESKGLIIEVGSVKTQIGRRPMMLKFNGKCACVAAIDLSGATIKICISDLEGSIMESGEIESGEYIDKDIIFAVEDKLEEMLKKTDNACGKLHAICIGSPGNIDPETGLIRYALRIRDFENLDLGKIFSERFGVKVLVKNDVNLAVSGEHVFGIGAGVHNLIYVSVDNGVGAGIILSHQLYEGSRGFAGEIGLTLTESGDRLDEVCSSNRIVSNVIRCCKDGEETCINDMGMSYDDITLDVVAHAVAQNDSLCVREVTESAKQLAYTLRNIYELLDMDMVIIGGNVMKLGNTYLKTLCDEFGDDVKVNWSMLADKATLSGAIGEAIKLAVKQIIDMQSA